MSPKRTYQDLLAWLQNLTPEQRKTTVTIHNLVDDTFESIDCFARLRDDDPDFDQEGGQPVLLITATSRWVARDNVQSNYN